MSISLRELRLGVATTCLVLGFGIGWFAGYTVPAAKRQKELLRQYQRVKDAFGMTDEQLAEIGALLPTMREDMKRTDEFAAAVALKTLSRLEWGDPDGARQILEMTVCSYYAGHSHDGDSNMLKRIERYAATNAVISNIVFELHGNVR